MWWTKFRSIFCLILEVDHYWFLYQYHSSFTNEGILLASQSSYIVVKKYSIVCNWDDCFHFVGKIRRLVIERVILPARRNKEVENSERGRRLDNSIFNSLVCLRKDFVCLACSRLLPICKFSILHKLMFDTKVLYTKKEKASTHRVYLHI